MPKEFEANYDPELEAKYGPANQIILSYSWRAIKESTTMLKVLLDRVPCKGQKDLEQHGLLLKATYSKTKLLYLLEICCSLNWLLSDTVVHFLPSTQLLFLVVNDAT